MRKVAAIGRSTAETLELSREVGSCVREGNTATAKAATVERVRVDRLNRNFRLPLRRGARLAECWNGRTMMAVHTAYRRDWRCSGRIVASYSTTSRLENHHILSVIVDVTIFLVLEKRLRIRLSICRQSRRW